MKNLVWRDMRLPNSCTCAKWQRDFQSVLMLNWIFIMDHELSIELVLQSLPDSYSQFIMNFNTNKIEYTLSELLKTVEPNVKASIGHVLAIQFSKGIKRKIKGNFKKNPRKLRAITKQ